MKTIDITGQRFGQLIALAREGVTIRMEQKWRCRCDCGHEVVIAVSMLRSGRRASCAICGRRKAGQARTLDVKGCRFGRLIAIEYAGRVFRGCRVWRCMCDCGKEAEAAASHLVQGVKISCGCAMHDRTSETKRSEKVRRRMLALQNQRRARQLNADGSYTENQISELFFRQKGKCASCLCKVTMDTLHRDHKQPLTRGGSNHIDNIQLLCVSCNVRKHTMNHIEFARKQGRLL